MAKPKKKQSKEDKLAKDRQRKREKYGIIKSNPQLYELQKEKERRRYLVRKEQKKISSINEMTPRAQREQRKRWRVNSTKYLRKKKDVQTIERILLDNSPPPSDTEIVNVEENIGERDPLQAQICDEQTVNVKTRIRRLRYKHLKEVKKLKTVIRQLKERINNKQNEQKTAEKDVNRGKDSAQKRVDELVSDVPEEKREKIRKKLFFAETMSKNINEQYNKLDKKDKKPFAEQILNKRDQMKKYKILNLVPFSSRPQIKKQTIQKTTLPEKIKLFLEDDSNSSMAPGKREYIKYKGIKYQKRYLRESLSILHEKFCKSEVKVGYSTFCRSRPVWIVAPKNRDTCGCKLHSNTDLIIGSLKKAGIVKEGSSSEILKQICCSTTNEKCLERQCQQCAHKIINYQEFSNEEKINYYQWLTEKQKYKGKDGKEKTTNVTIKKKLEDYPRNIIQNFEEVTLPKFLVHTKNIVAQYASIKELKKDLKNDEILIHIDFSENYCLKYNSEIQSFHFGGSRGQVSLHTGVLYYKDNEASQNTTTKSFCTISKCLQHDAASVWAHLIPVLDMAKEVASSIKVVHFLSDSPTSQYRNKFIFYMMTQLKKHIPDLERVTWNYQEAGHGKGAPDGIGAVVKRAADQFVNHGGDVDSFETFEEVISQNVRNVKIIKIKEEAILSTKFPSNIPTFKGTMNVHQAMWCSSLPHTIAFRKLSCFRCISSYIPCHHNRHLGVLSTGIDSKHTEPREVGTLTTNTNAHEHYEVQSAGLTVDREIGNEFSELNLTAPVVQPILNDNILCESDLNLDSPTIRNNISNIDDAVLLSQIDDQMFLSTSKTASPQPIINETAEKDQVTILSNVKFDWQNYKFKRNKSTVFYQSGQDEFKKFISVDIKPIITEDETTNKENISNDEDLDTHKNDTECSYGNTSQKINDKENSENILRQCQNHNIGDWIVVQYRIKSQVYAYIGKIKDVSDDTYTVLFLKKTSVRANSMFSWPTVVDEDTIPESRIFCTLDVPEINRRGQYSFKKLPDLKFR